MADKKEPKCAYGYNNNFSSFASNYDESTKAQNYYNCGIYILKNMQVFWDNNIDDIIVDKIISFEADNSTGNAKNALKEYLIYEKAKAKDIWDSFIYGKTEYLKGKLDELAESHNVKYESWNEHVSHCDICNTSQNGMTTDSFTPNKLVEATRYSSTGESGVKFKADFADMSDLITAVKDAQKSIQNLEIDFSTEFGNKYFGAMKSRFDSFKTDANTKLNRVCDELENIINAATDFTKTFNNLNRPVLDE